jgi:hypothetical protein
MRREPGSSIAAVTTVMSIEELDDAQVQEYKRICEEDINWDDYFEANGIRERRGEPWIHYIKHWREEMPVVPDFFDTRGYLSLYPDVRDAGTNPLLHYILHGRREGRDPCFNIGNTVAGGIANKSRAKTIVVSHESSATGAPLLGLNIARELGRRFNVVHIVMKESSLQEHFRAHCETLISGVHGSTGSRAVLSRLKRERAIHAVICNSVETHDVLNAASGLGLPTVCLVNEFADYTS